MKKIYLSFFLFLPIILAAQIPNQENQPEPGTRKINQVNLTVQHFDGYSEVVIDLKDLTYQLEFDSLGQCEIILPGYMRSTNFGEPDLPYQKLAVSLPEKVVKSSASYSYLEERSTEIGPGLILPHLVPTARPASDPSLTNDTMGFVGEKNMWIYSKNSYFPSQNVIVKPALVSGGTFKVLLEVRPFIYNPVQGILKRLDFIKIRLDYDIDPSIIEKEDETLENQFPGEFLEKEYQINSSLPTDSGYVIVTTNSIVAGSERLNDFINLKTAQGFSVYVATEDDYGSVTGQYPNGTADKIRQWLIENRETLNIRYLLLIGDPHPETGEVPMKMLYPRAGTTYNWNDYKSPSDSYYSNLTGNWDLDGDGLFGEQYSINSPNSPDPLIEPNSFSIRWEGKYEVTNVNGVRLAGFFDDGCRIWINGTLVIDKWYDGFANSFFYDIGTPGLYQIIIEYYQNKQNGSFHLFQGNIGASSFNYVPLENLYFFDGETYNPGGLRGTYFNNINLTDSVFSRIDPGEGNYEFGFRWYSGDNGDGGVNFNPDILVGRIPSYDNNFNALDSILFKTVLYEVDNDSLWRKNILLPMKPFDNYTPNYHLGEQIKDSICIPENFSSFRIYDEAYNCTPPPESIPCIPENVLNAWNQPFGMTVWATHGGATSASSVLNSSQCLELSNYFPSIVIQGSCYNGFPEIKENLGYSLLRNGAVATISATRPSWYATGTTYAEPWNRYIHGFCFHPTNQITQGLSVGESLFNVKNFDASISGDVYWMNAFVFNIYGDPSLKIMPSDISTILSSTKEINFGAVSNGNDLTKSYKLYLKNLFEPLTISASDDFLISLDEFSGFDSTLNLTDQISNCDITVYVKFIPNGINFYTGSINHQSNEVSPFSISTSGSGISETPNSYVLSGGGIYCSGAYPSGISISLSGSEPGVGYQLLRFENVYDETSGEYLEGFFPFGQAVVGTGNPIIWNDIIWGNYSAQAIYNGSETFPMNGLVSVSEENTYAFIGINYSSVISCEGSPATFTANEVGLGENPLYQWYVNDQPFGTNSPTFTYIPNDNDTLGLTAFSNEVCIQNNPVISEPIVLDVLPIVPLSITITEDQNDVCEGTMITLTASYSSGGSTPNFQWRKNGLPIGGNSPTLSYFPANGDQILVNMYTNHTCPSAFPATSNIIELTVNPSLPVGVIIYSDQPEVCQGSLVTFYSVIENGGDNPSFQWRANEELIGSNCDTLSYAPQPYEFITLEVYSNQPCVTNNPAISDVPDFILIESPVVSWDFPITDTVCFNSGPILLSGGLPVGGYYSGPGVEEGYFFPDIAGPGSHIIRYTFSNDYECAASAEKEIFVDYCTSVPLISQNVLEMYVFPNPAKDQITIKFSQDSFVGEGILIITPTGQIALTKNAPISNNFIVQVEDFEPGVYQLLLKTKFSHLSERFIIIK